MIQPLLPMLAAAGEPFDSTDHIFEVKWDGIRALASVESQGWRLWGRDRADYTFRYPELEILRSMPTGTLLDGELVVLGEGPPDLSAILRRHGLTGQHEIRRASRATPVTYVLFDLLYRKGRSVCGQPLSHRRQMLAELLARHKHPRLAFSEGVTGAGRGFFTAAVSQGHEGVMAKHLTSRYLPGQRSSAWQKIKPCCSMLCVIIGYRPGPYGIRSLLVAAEREGRLQYVGHVSAGFSDQIKAQLGRLLAERRCAKPVVGCPHKAVWVKPDLFCQVRFLHWTVGGRLRAACFAGLITARS